MFDTKDSDDSRAIMTEIKAGENTILVAIRLRKKDNKINLIASIYGKDNEKILNWLKKGRATYINKEKILTSLQGPSGPIPDAFADKGEESFSAAKVQTFSDVTKYLQGLQKFDRQ